MELSTVGRGVVVLSDSALEEALKLYAYTTGGGALEIYDGSIQTIRSGLLANLSAETAEKVAYKNAQALLGLQ